MCFIVTAQEGPGIVIAHPGQDVELLCTVTEDSQDLTEAWIVNNGGPYKIISIYGDTLTGYNANIDGGNLIVENIMMNDNRNGSEYECVIAHLPADPEDVITLADIINKSDPTYLYVAGK